MLKKVLLLLIAFVMITSFTQAQDFKLPGKGNSYITFGYTPFVSDVKAIETVQDPNLVTVGYGKYLTNDLALEGNLGIMAKKNYTSYAIGGNVVYNFLATYKVEPFLVGGATFTGTNEVKTGVTTIQNALSLSTGLGVNYYFNSNLSVNASYKLDFSYWMKPKVNGVTGTDEYFNLGTGIGKIAISVYW